jgi:glycosyltransferase involved in cell wall biosynthesis
MIKHSFAVMAYKDSPFLPECLDSLKNQTFKSEIFITTSTPSTYIIETAKKYGIKLLITESGFGIAHDWNFSLAAASTKYVTLAHQDDLYNKQYSELSVKAAEKFNDTLICFSKYSEIVNGRERDKTFMLNIKRIMNMMFMPFQNNIKQPLCKSISQAFGTSIACPSVLFNKEMLPDFKFSEKYKISLDWDAWIRLSKIKGRFVYIPKTLLNHRIHEHSETTSGLKDNVRQKEDFEIFSQIWPTPIARLLSGLYELSYKSNEI